jgi:archaellum component FlaC
MKQDDEMMNHNLDSNFGGSSSLNYTAAPLQALDKNVYAVASISVDVSSSVRPFHQELEESLKSAIDGIEDKSQSDAKKGVAMLLRCSTFNSTYSAGNQFAEIHGFKEVANIDTSQYHLPLPEGGTPLLEAMMRDLDIEKHFTDQMSNENILSSALLLWVTDGEDTASGNISYDQVDARIKQLQMEEDIDSVTTVVFGINEGNQKIKNYLDKLCKECNIDYYVPFQSIKDEGGKALAKLITEVSKTVSSSAGTGVKPDLSDILDL